MSEVKHTPGPWHVGVKQAERIVYDSTGWAVANATVYHGEHSLDTLPNARLIAAAPDLLCAARAAIAALSQNATYPADIAAAKKWLADAIVAAES